MNEKEEYIEITIIKKKHPTEERTIMMVASLEKLDDEYEQAMDVFSKKYFLQRIVRKVSTGTLKANVGF
jgi:hypothetical protein